MPDPDAALREVQLLNQQHAAENYINASRSIPTIQTLAAGLLVGPFLLTAILMILNWLNDARAI